MLFRKMLRDMRLNKAQFISIFLMTFLGIYIYCGVAAEWSGLTKTLDTYYKDTNFANAWIYGKGFSEAEANAAEMVDGVSGVERRLTIEGMGDFDHKPIIKLHFIEDDRISTSYIKEGEDFSVNQDGIWLDSLFAKENGLTVGDNISVVMEGLSLTKEIRGFVFSPEYVYSAGGDDVIPVRKDYGYAFLSSKAFPKNIPMIYTELLITTNREVDAKLEKDIDMALKGKYSVFLSRNNLRSHMQFSEEIKEHKAMGRVFPILFLAVAILTMITTMIRLVNNQRTQIGILKAIGFSGRRILMHYVSYGLWLSIAGAVLGLVLGPITLPYLFYGPMKTAYTLPEWKPFFSYQLIFMAFLAIACSALATYLACRNVLKETPTESLRPKSPKISKFKADKFGLWNRLGFDTQWNVRDIFRSKGRTIMAVTGILGCSALLICAFGMQDTFDYLVKWNYGIINRYETIISLEDTAVEEQTATLVSRFQGETIEESAVELRSKDIKRSGELLVTDQVSLIRFVDQERKEIILPTDQISISYKMAEVLKVEIGDTIEWHRFGEEKWNSSVIGAIYRTPFSQGISMSRKHYEEYGYEYLPTSVLTAEDVTNQILAGDNNHISKVQNKEMLIASYNSLSEAMNVLVYVLLIAAAILAAVVIYNLGILSFTERQRELSTLKVIGFGTKKLRNLLLKQNTWLTLVGILPGIPIGKLILNYIFSFVGDVFDFMIMVDFTSYLYTVIGTMLISTLVNRVFSGRVKKLDMVSSLKGVE